MPPAFDNPAIRGAVLMSTSAFLFAGVAILVRFASAEMHPLEITFWRNALAIVVMAPWLMRHGLGGLKTTRPVLMTARGTVGFIAMGCLFTAIAIAPVAEVAALNFTVPLFATALAPLIIKEKVGIRRWSAACVGFLGAMIVLRPGLIEISTGGVLALTAAGLMATALTMVKLLSDTEPTERIVAWAALVMTPLSLVPALFFWSGWPSLTMFAVLFAIAFLATVSQNLLGHAFKAADQSYVFVFDFLRLPFIAAMAWIAFGETVDGWTWIGAGVIFAAATYTARREATLKRRNDATSQSLNARPSDDT